MQPSSGNGMYVDYHTKDAFACKRHPVKISYNEAWYRAATLTKIMLLNVHVAKPCTAIGYCTSELDFAIYESKVKH